MKIYSIKLNQKLDNITFNHLLRFVSISKKTKILKFYRWQDAHRTLLGELLIRKTVFEDYKILNDQIIFTTNEYGKPFLRNINDFHFNISHSGDWIVCAIDKKSIGVDVEQINPVDLEISKRFFSNQEHTDLMNKCKNDRISYFFSLWTLKESYIKAVGRGLSLPLDSFTMQIFDTEIKMKIDGAVENKLFFKQYKIDSKYKMAVCASNNEFPKTLNNISIAELINNFL